MQLLNVHGREGQESDITQDAGDAVLGVLTCARRVIGAIDQHNDQVDAFSGRHIRRNLAIPGCKTPMVLSYVMAIDPNTRVAVHAVEAQDNGFAAKILRYVKGPAKEIFGVRLRWYALHLQFVGHLNWRPIQLAKLPVL